jgi:hypothetical protein
MAEPRTPRGIRNHNPGNIKKGDPWQGLAGPDEMTPAQKAERVFCVFRAAPWGIRAVARILIHYQDRRGIRTVAGAIARWAPPGPENDTRAYVAAVCARTGFAAGAELDFHRYDHARPLIEAIIAHENGCQPYPDAVLDKGLALAGIEPPPRGLSSSRTIAAGQVATAATTIGVAVSAVKEMHGVLPELGGLIAFVKAQGWPIGLGLATVTLAAVAWMIWARIDDHRRLAR